MADGEQLRRDPEGLQSSEGSDADDREDDRTGGASKAVVETRIVSPRGARVTETVFVLSSRASRLLEIRGEVPARGVSASAGRPGSRR